MTLEHPAQTPSFLWISFHSTSCFAINAGTIQARQNDAGVQAKNGVPGHSAKTMPARPVDIL